MAEVLDLEKIETEQKRELPQVEKDTWILKLPAEVCDREGYAEGTMISLTVKNSEIQTTIIQRTEKSKESAQRFIGKYGDFMKEIERVGD
jgi:hypothetical protein